MLCNFQFKGFVLLLHIPKDFVLLDALVNEIHFCFVCIEIVLRSAVVYNCMVVPFMCVCT